MENWREWLDKQRKELEDFAKAQDPSTPRWRPHPGQDVHPCDRKEGWKSPRWNECGTPKCRPERTGPFAQKAPPRPWQWVETEKGWEIVEIGREPTAPRIKKLDMCRPDPDRPKPKVPSLPFPTEY